MTKVQKTVDYTSPPLEEVVFGATFQRIEGFNVSTFGRYWATISDDFPITEDKPALPSISNEIDLGRPMVRSWYIAQDQRQLIQLQQDRFILNWRRIDSHWNEYPEYSNIVQTFERRFSDFAAFINSMIPNASLQVRELELSYVNTISLSSVSEIVSHIGLALVDHQFETTEGGVLPAPSAFNWSSEYKMKDNLGSLRVQAQSVRTKAEPDDEIMRLTLTCKGAPEVLTQESLRDWYDAAHDLIVTGFSEITKKEIQLKVWGKK